MVYKKKYFFSKSQSDISVQNIQDDIAIIGMACRFPGASHYQQFWKNLKQGINSITEITKDRWDINQYYSPKDEVNKSNSKWGGLLEHIDEFDNQFFNISSREAKVMDPQQRLLLEEVWHCIEDAAIPLKELQNKKTAVYVGVMTVDYQHRLNMAGNIIDSYDCLGNYECIAANRLSYFFNLTGESKSINTACSSSLVALHDARRSILTAEHDYAIVAGANLICHPWKYISFSKSHMLSPDGQCKTFDAEANGYVPGEGIGVLLLAPLKTAIEQNYRIHGILKGSAVRHTGKSRSITAPKVEAQAEVIKAALEESSIAAEAITYIEAHGTGTSLGDPIEVAGLTKAFQNATLTQTQVQYCAIGSVKTNIGHLEAAAGIAGVIKVLLMLKHKKFVPTLNVKRINPLIDFEHSPFYLNREYTDWTLKGQTKRYAGISSFGFGGVNAHVILEEHQSLDLRPRAQLPETLAYPFLLSTKTRDSLQTLISGWQEYVESSAFHEQSLADISYTLLKGREMLPYRLGLLVTSLPELVEQLTTLDNNFEPVKQMTAPIMIMGASFKVSYETFITICQQFPLLQKYYDVCCQTLIELGQEKLVKKWQRDKNNAGYKVLFEGVALYSCSSYLLGLGFQPQLITGSGIGRVIAASVSGYLSLTDALQLLLQWGQEQKSIIFFQTLNIAFYDSYVQKIIYPFNLDTDTCSQLLQQLLNGPSILTQLETQAQLLRENQFTFKQYLEEWDKALQQELNITLDQLWQKAKSKLVNLKLKEYNLLLQIIFLSSITKLQRKWELTNKSLNPNPQLLAITELIADGILPYRLVVSWLYNSDIKQCRQVASILQHNAKQIDGILLTNLFVKTHKLKKKSVNADTWLKTDGQKIESVINNFSLNISHIVVLGDTSLKSDLTLEACEALATYLPKLWAQGLLNEGINKVYAFSGQIVSLPPYPFAKSSHWVAGSNLTFFDSNEPTKTFSPLIDTNISTLGEEQSFIKLFTGKEFYLADHQVNNVPTLPGVIYIEMVRAASELAFKERRECNFHNIIWRVPIRIVDGKNQQVYISLHTVEAGVEFEISTKTTIQADDTESKSVPFSKQETLVHARGLLIYISQNLDKPPILDVAIIKQRCHNQHTKEECYNRFKDKGLHYGTTFQTIQEFWYNEQEALATLKLPEQVADKISNDQFELHPSILDGILQSAILLDSSDNLALPFSISEFTILDRIPTKCYVYITMELSPMQKFQIQVLDEAGSVVSKIKDFVTRPLAQKNSQPITVPEFYYKPIWTHCPIEESAILTNPQVPQNVLLVATPDTLILQEELIKSHIEDNITILDCQSATSWLEQTTQNIDIIYFLSPTNISEAKPITSKNINSNNKKLLLLFHLLKAIIRKNLVSNPFVLKIVTFNAYSLDTNEDIFPYEAGLLGLAQFFAKEYSSILFSCIDLAIQELQPHLVRQQAQAILQEPFDNGSKVILFRNGKRYVRILEPLIFQRSAIYQEELLKTPFRKKGTYLIIGGAGGIGFVLSQHLAKNYQANLVWVGRRPEIVHHDKMEAIKILGGSVLYYQGNVADLKNMQQMLQTVKAYFGEINGAIHSALVLKDKMLANLDEGLFQEALIPKIEGSIVLASILAQEPLDFLLFFSSIQSFWQNKGQSNYGTGCIFQDQFVQSLQANSTYPVKLINWGYWGSVGAVATPTYQRYMAAAGIESIEPEEGIKAIYDILTYPIIQLVAIKAKQSTLEQLGVSNQHLIIVPTDTLPSCIDHVVNITNQYAQSLPLNKQASFELIDKWSYELLLYIFHKMGVFKQPDEYYTYNELIKLLNIIPSYERLFDALLDILIRSKLVHEENRGFVLNNYQMGNTTLEKFKIRKNELQQQYPDFNAHIELLFTCVTAYPQVLTGNSSHMSVMFPEGSMSLVEGIYQGPTADYYNSQMAYAIQSYVKERLSIDPGAKINILEIGAGTGGTSRFVFKAIEEIKSSINSYIYSDISIAFLNFGRNHWEQQYPWISFKLLNIEEELGKQGFTLQNMDIILASNVLHATKDIEEVLNNVKHLLKPKGLLVFNELIERTDFATLTFGLTTGWWLFKDEKYRIPFSPALTSDKWKIILEKSGFKSAFIEEKRSNTKVALAQQIIFAESDGVIRIANNQSSNVDMGIRYYSAQISSPLSTFTQLSLKFSHSVNTLSQHQYLTDELLEKKTQDYIKVVFSEVLKIDANTIGNEEAFEKYGIDSLLGLELIKHFEKGFGTLPPTLLFEKKTINELTGYFINNYSSILKEKFNSNEPTYSGNSEKLYSPRAQGNIIQNESEEYAISTLSQHQYLTDELLEKKTQDYIKVVFSEVLKIDADTIGNKEAFEKYGIDSLLTLELVKYFEKTFGTLPPTLLFENKTINELAGYFFNNYSSILNRKFNSNVPVHSGNNERLYNVQYLTEAQGSNIIYNKVQVVEDYNKPPGIVHDAANRFKPFPLNDIQEAFLVGRKLPSYGNYVGSHLYFEIEEYGLDVHRLNKAWNRLIAHHDILRVTILASGEQRVSQEVSEYKFNVYTVQDSTESGFSQHLRGIRQRMSHQVYQPGQCPLFEIGITECLDNRFIIHVSIDDIIVDGMSFNLLLTQWRQLYKNPELQLPSIDITFRDYVVSLQKLEDSEAYQESLSYWFETLANMPGDPLLDKALNIRQLANNEIIERRTLSGMLSKEQWLSLKSKAKRLNVSPSILLLTIFSEVIAIWSDKDTFSLILTTFNRALQHNQIKQLIGPLSSTQVFINKDHTEYSLLEKIKLNQTQILSGLLHNQLSGVRILRELRAQSKAPANIQLGIVFTSMLLDSFQGTSEEDRQNWFYNATYRVTQTPQIYLDHHIWECDGSLYFNWYVVEELFSKNLLHEMFDDYCDVLVKLAEEKINWQQGAVRNEILYRNFLLETNYQDPYQEFQTTDLQQAYLVGRTDKLQNGQISCTNYQEFEIQNIDIKRLNKAWQTLIGTHETLRGTISHEGQQRILNDVPIYEIEVIDLRKYERQETEEKLRAIRENILNKVFPLSNWPYFELKISLLTSELAILHFNIDLMIVDAPSNISLYKQLFQLYLDPNLTLTKPAISFKEYIGFINDYTKFPYSKLSMEYWQKKMMDLPSGPSLFSSNMLDNKVTPKHKRLSKTLHNWGLIKKRTETLNVPPDLVLLTAYGEAISTCCRESSFTIVVVGWDRFPIHQDINSLIGELAQLSWLRIDQDKQLSFTEKLLNNFQQIKQDQKHHIIGGLKTLRRIALRDGKLLSFPVVYTSILDQPSHIAENIQFTYGLSQTPQVSLDCISFEDGDSLHLHWDTLIDQLPIDIIETAFDTYCNILENLVQDELYWNKPLVLANIDVANIQYIPNIALNEDLLHSDFISQVGKNPQQIAIITPNKQISYEGLLKYSIASAKQIEKFIPSSNNTIGIIMEKGWEQVVAALGTLLSGNIFLPIDFTNPPERINYILENANVQIVLTQSKLAENLKFLIGKKIIIIDKNHIEEYGINISTLPAKKPVHRDDLAYIIFTSGSTGLPKGVMISHKGAKNTILDINQRFAVNSKDKIFAISALSFDLSIYDIFGTLSAGATIVLPDIEHLREPHCWSELLIKHQVTIWNSAPALMQMLVMYAASHSNTIPQSLRLVLLSGDRIPIKLPFQIKNHVSNVEVISLGGATEASIWSVIHKVVDEDAGKPSIPYGRAMLNQTMYVLDQDLNLCSTSLDGEIYIGGIGLAKGYLNDKEKTLASFVQHPSTGERLYKTGDIGYYDHNGEIIFVGRVDSQVKIRGFRIELAEIQLALLEHQDIQEAIVVVKDELSGDPKLVVYLITTLALDRALLTKELKQFLGGKLPPYMIPHIFITIDALPITANGKVDYKALPWPNQELVSEAISKQQGGTVQSTELIEATLMTMFKEILKNSNIEVGDDLFMHGISSLNMVIASEKIQDRFGLIIPIETIIKDPTISGIAKYIFNNQKEVNKPDIVHSIQAKPEVVISNMPGQLKEKAPNIRDFSESGMVITLPQSNFHNNSYYLRASQYNFLPQKISFAYFAKFLELLKQAVINNETKYLYSSAGKTYAVQTYIYLKEWAVEGLNRGLYYYHPIKHELQLISDGLSFNREHHFLYNKDHFDKAGFAIYFIAQLDVIAPTYGVELARNAVLLEVGHMCQLLMLNQANYNIGLCSIGGVDFEKIRDSFKLDSGHFFVHSVIGGYINYDSLKSTAEVLIPNYAISKVATKSQAKDIEPQIAIIGVSGRYPKASNIDEFWDNLKIGKKAISEFPLERLSHNNNRAASIRWGGFLPSIDQFDNLLFNISPMEARNMDPQERLFLEVVWECLENAGYTNEQLNKLVGKVGVFVGAMWNDYANVGVENWQDKGVAEAFSLHSSIANRISYYFNFTGPSVAVDTSCSSSLTALHLACESIKRGECSAAIVGGINLITHPYHLDLINNLGLVSKENKSFAFSAEGSGWIAGEGAGAILILPKELAEGNYDHIHALVKGTAINHIGKSTQYGMPNIEAQVDSIKSVLKSAKCSTNQINYIETAATGATIADAAEISALRQVFREGQDNHLTYPIGTIKSTIGHLESASGMSQLTKVILQLKHKKITPTIIEGQLNPLLELERSPFFIPRTLCDWQEPKQCSAPLMALINAFGATGNCGHAILEEYTDPLSHTMLSSQVIIVLSAASEAQLKEYVHKLYKFLIRPDNSFLITEPWSLQRIAYTLQLGRRAMTERLAFIVNDINELMTKLKAYLEVSSTTIQGCYRGTADKANMLASSSNQIKDLEKIAELWVKGYLVQWEQLYTQPITKIPLPTYPFARESHWLSSSNIKSQINGQNASLSSLPIQNSNLHIVQSVTVPQNYNVLLSKTSDYLLMIFSEESGIALQKINAKSLLEEYGLNSLLITRLNLRLSNDFGELSKTLFFEYKTLYELAQFFATNYYQKLISLFKLNNSNLAQVLDKQPNSLNFQNAVSNNSSFSSSIAGFEQRDIAIIGISGKYPQADNLEEFWENLKNAKNCITKVPKTKWDNNLLDNLVRSKFGTDKHYSKMGGFIKDADKFDPLFFNLSPQEAEFMDPQERVFLEVVWAALEDACYTPDTLKSYYGNNVGVYAGVMYSEYQFYGAHATVSGSPIALSPGGALVANRVSSCFDLHGPSITVDTMCSSSLTSIYLAVNSLLQQECQLAIAGGINLLIHPNRYVVQTELNMASSSGYCKSFGEGGDGYVCGEGAGAVILKPLSLAIRDNDRIYGVIKSAVVNNNGKTNGRAVPSPVAQGKLVSDAIAKANIDPRSISYIEAHGTGTALGDPIEINGLMRGFAINNINEQFCAIGSVKSNIGHLEAAAGIAGLTKVLLQLKYKQLVPSLHSEVLNPNINFGQTPFYVQRELTEWKTANDFPRRAGISSFGAGGSNAHLIIEEGPQYILSTEQTKPYYLLTLSARHPGSLKQRISTLGFHLQKHYDVPLEAISYTLNMGRAHFEYRCAFVVSSLEELKTALEQLQQGKIPQNYFISEPTTKIKIEPLFEELIIKILEDLKGYQALDISIYNKKLLALADLYIRGYTLDWQLLHYGEEKKKISLPTYPFLKERYWAVENNNSILFSASQPISSKLHPLIDKNTSSLNECSFKTYFTGGEFYLQDHQILGEKVLPGVVYIEMARAAGELAMPTKEIVKFETVTWIKPLIVGKEGIEATVRLKSKNEQVSYEVCTTQKNQEVIHCQGVFSYGEQLEAKAWVNIEQLEKQITKSYTKDEFYKKFSHIGLNYGPAFQVLEWVKVDDENILASYSLQLPLDDQKGYKLHPTIIDGALQACAAFNFVQNEQLTTLLLPFSLEELQLIHIPSSRGYIYIKRLTGKDNNLAFQVLDIEGQVCVELGNLNLRPANIRQSTPQLSYYTPSWAITELQPNSENTLAIQSLCVICNDNQLLDNLRIQLPEVPIIQLKIGDNYIQDDKYTYQIRMGEIEDYLAFIHAIEQQGIILSHFILGRSLGQTPDPATYLETDLREIVIFIKALIKNGTKGNLRFIAPYYYATSVLPIETMLLGFAKSLHLEQSRYQLQLVGLEVTASIETKLAQIIAELKLLDVSHVRYQGNQRLVEHYAPLMINESRGYEQLPFRQGGSYLITGGLGGLGLIFAKYLAKTYQATLILTGRSELTANMHTKCNELETLGATVLYLQGDVSNKDVVEGWIEVIKSKFGNINGIIHCAGILRDSLLVNKDWSNFQAVMLPKMLGTINLDEATQNEKLNFFVLFSSIVGCLGNVGQTDYATANAFLNYFATWRDNQCQTGKRYGTTLAINWPYWCEGGMQIGKAAEEALMKQWSMSPLPTNIGVQAFIENLTLLPIQSLVTYGYQHQIKQIFEKQHLVQKNDLVQHKVEIVNEGALFQSTITFLKQKIASILKLPIDRLDEDTSFERYGFDSLTIVSANSELEQDFGRLSTTLYFEHNTLTKLTHYFIESYKDILRDKFHLSDTHIQSSQPIIGDQNKLYEPFPVTDMQHAYLVGRTKFFELGDIAGHVYIELSFSNLNLQQFNYAWQQLVIRHPMLRATFSESGTQQILNDTSLFEVELVDITNKDKELENAEFLKYRRQLQRHKFDATKWPLFICKAFYRGDREYIVSICVDLLIMDGRSIKILFQELFDFYHNPQTNLPPIEFTFRDYRLAYIALQKTHAYEAARQYWLARLETLPEAPQLPILKIENEQHPGFKRLLFKLEHSRWKKFKEIAWGYQVSPVAVLCTIYGKILSYWSKEPKFSIVAMSTNRHPFHADVNKIVANFSSTLILELDFSQERNFIDQAKIIYNQLLQDMEHSLFSGVELLHELNKRRGSGKTPSMPIVFNSMLDNSRHSLDLQQNMDIYSEVDLNNYYSYMETPQVKIDHQLMEDYSGNLVINWDYVIGCFPEKMMEAMFETYQILLHKLVNEPSYWLEKIALDKLAHSDSLTNAILEVNNTNHDFGDGLLHQGFIEYAKTTPEQIAIITSTKQISYKTLYQYVVNVAAKLQKEQTDNNKPIAIIMDKGWGQVVATLSILFAGSAYLPIDASFPPDRINYILENANVEIVLIQDKLKNNLAFLQAKKIISINEKLFEKSYTSFVPTTSISSDNLAYIIYTSGSTGLPKGVMVSHKAARNTILDINEQFQVNSKDKLFAISALSFDLSVYDIFGILSTGATLVIPDANLDKDPAHWVSLLNTHQVTIWNSAPPLMQMLLTHTTSHSKLIPQSLRLALLSGDWISVSMPNQLKQLVNHIQVISLGGATEAAIWSIFYPIQEQDMNRDSIPYGKPMHNQKIYIFDHNFNLRPAWVTGQLYIGGIGLAKGYLNDEEKTLKSFIMHPSTGERLYRTGDLGYYEPDGTIILVGREDYQVKVRGHRIELQEIEITIKLHPEIKEAVVSFKAETQSIIAYVAYKDRTLTNETLLQYLEQKLPTYMLPSKIIAMEEFQITSNGKINRNALPDLDYTVIVSKKKEYIPPSTETEKQIYTIWTKYLGVDLLGIRDNFFDVGGDSFKAVLVMSEIYKLTHKELSINVLLSEEGTIENLAKHVDKASDNIINSNFNHLIKINSVVKGEPIFFVHPIGGSALCYRSLTTKLVPNRPFYGLQSSFFKTNNLSPVKSIEELSQAYLEEIQAINPHGPYSLGGWSMGGAIAYEIGQKIHRQGKKVNWIAMIDTPLPIKMGLTNEELLKWFMVDLLRNSLSKTQLEILETTPLKNNVRTWFKKLQNENLLPTGLDESKINEFFKLFKNNYQILNAYQPEPSDLKLIKFKATAVPYYYNNHPNKANPDWGWETFTSSSIDHFLIDADHYTIISQPDELATLLNNYL